ncbi:Hypothetical predicted protein [Octopus vulgaris]|uniref:Uncharacterized protein n=1 Tax=Octopus vulgaris TaxID=6645 RepID=A0AA36AQL5_OCTVU|nr:Hypothetical predicted protein [Octopus vulgaris]
MKHFWHFLGRRQFTVVTGHCSAVENINILPETYDIWISFHNTVDIRYIQGTDNSAADTLSHVHTDALHTPDSIDLQQIALD